LWALWRADEPAGNTASALKDDRETLRLNRRIDMNSRLSRALLVVLLAGLPIISAACGASSYGSGSQSSGTQSGNLNMVISDAATDDWAAIDVKISNIALVPQGGGDPVSVYTGSSMINLVELDQLGEILGNLSVPVGTYSAAILSISANPGDVVLTAASNPETGFAATPGATVPPSQIQIQGATGSAGAKTVSVKVNFASPLVVTANENNTLDLEFDLSHPAFLVGHVPPALSGTTIWAVNFNGPVRRRLHADLRRLVLRHVYGNVSSVSTDNTSITIKRAFPVEPPATPETSVASLQSLQILADATNGTIFYDVDARTNVTIKNFAALSASLGGKYVRVAARYQSNGSLVAVRMWASNSFNSVWLSPEGHVLHVNTATNVVTVENETGVGIPLTVDANTQFFYRTPWNAVADTTPIGIGTGFLANHNLVRGFKVHASVVDPLAVPLVAQTIDIEIARYDGNISGANLNDFTYTRAFATAADSYTVNLPFISPSTPNGSDPASGAAINGYKWWNFTFPTIVDSGTNAILDFDNATNGSVNFGGTLGLFPADGETFATWNDPASANTWAAPWTVLTPTTVPLGTAATSYSNGSFMLSETAAGGTLPVTVNLSTTAGSGTLVYQVDRTSGVVTISAVDITTTQGQNTITSNLIAATPVKVFGIPQANGTIKAYVVFYYTGVKPTV